MKSIKFLLLIVLLPGAIQAESSKDSTFKRILNNIQTQQKEAVSKVSTVPKSVPRSDVVQVLAGKGGSSDGGGNAVGEILLDFYENRNSFSVTTAQLRVLQPQFSDAIKKLNELGEIQNGIFVPFGESILEALGRKNLILDLKEIASEGCINESMIATNEKSVVGCQDDYEVRFHLPWLANVSAENQAGLIMHEGLLAWARSRFNGTESKVNLEKKIRLLNRNIFNENSNWTVAEKVKQLFNTHFITFETAQKAQAINQALKIELTNFCEKPNPGLIQLLKQLPQNPHFMDALTSSDFLVVNTVLNSLHTIMFNEGVIRRVKVRSFESVEEIQQNLQQGSMTPTEISSIKIICTAELKSFRN